MKNLLKCDGRRFRAKIEGTPCEGKIRVEDGCAYLCQNEEDGTDCYDKLGYEYSWLVVDGSHEELVSHDVTDFQLLPTTASEIEAYKDWQVGDKVSRPDVDGPDVMEVIFRFGKVVILESVKYKTAELFTCDELYNEGFRLVADPEPEVQSVELTLYDLVKEAAEKRGIPISKIRIKKE